MYGDLRNDAGLSFLGFLFTPYILALGLEKPATQQHQRTQTSPKKSQKTRKETACQTGHVQKTLQPPSHPYCQRQGGESRLSPLTVCIETTLCAGWLSVQSWDFHLCWVVTKNTLLLPVGMASEETQQRFRSFTITRGNEAVQGTVTKHPWFSACDMSRGQGRG